MTVHTITYMDTKSDKPFIETLNTKQLFTLMQNPDFRVLEIHTAATKESFKRSLWKYNYRNKTALSVKGVFLFFDEDIIGGIHRA